MKEETQSDFLLSVARGAILLRAAMDGYDDGYDARRDPEGYVASLLNALHRWCHASGIDWHRELATAQGLFEEDSGGESTDADPPTVEELRCPSCGRREAFFVETSQCLLMFPDGAYLEGDQPDAWGDWSHCRCHACGHAGTVHRFRERNQDLEENGHG